MMRPQATFSFFIHFTTFSFFHSPRHSFLLVPLSFLSLFPPHQALSKSFRIHERPFFIDFDKSITINQPTNQLIEMGGCQTTF